ncbi:MAG: hypothetical protein P9M06_07200, partial [Candidatus Saelkia tenebricola]|nr:hypothetical protein [Candidatus Saelkia tenebricola]
EGCVLFCHINKNFYKVICKKFINIIIVYIFLFNQFAWANGDPLSNTDTNSDAVLGDTDQIMQSSLNDFPVSNGDQTLQLGAFQLGDIFLPYKISGYYLEDSGGQLFPQEMRLYIPLDEPFGIFHGPALDLSSFTDHSREFMEIPLDVSSHFMEVVVDVQGTVRMIREFQDSQVVKAVYYRDRDTAYNLFTLLREATTLDTYGVAVIDQEEESSVNSTVAALMIDLSLNPEDIVDRALVWADDAWAVIPPEYEPLELDDLEDVYDIFAKGYSRGNSSFTNGLNFGAPTLEVYYEEGSRDRVLIESQGYGVGFHWSLQHTLGRSRFEFNVEAIDYIDGEGRPVTLQFSVNQDGSINNLMYVVEKENGSVSYMNYDITAGELGFSYGIYDMVGEGWEGEGYANFIRDFQAFRDQHPEDWAQLLKDDEFRMSIFVNIDSDNLEGEVTDYVLKNRDGLLDFHDVTISEGGQLDKFFEEMDEMTEGYEAAVADYQAAVADYNAANPATPTLDLFQAQDASELSSVIGDSSVVAADFMSFLSSQVEGYGSLAEFVEIFGELAAGMDTALHQLSIGGNVMRYVMDFSKLYMFYNPLMVGTNESGDPSGFLLPAERNEGYMPIDVDNRVSDREEFTNFLNWLCDLEILPDEAREEILTKLSEYCPDGSTSIDNVATGWDHITNDMNIYMTLAGLASEYESKGGDINADGFWGFVSANIPESGIFPDWTTGEWEERIAPLKTDLVDWLVKNEGGHIYEFFSDVLYTDLKLWKVAFFTWLSCEYPQVISGGIEGIPQIAGQLSFVPKFNDVGVDDAIAYAATAWVLYSEAVYWINIARGVSATTTLAGMGLAGGFQAKAYSWVSRAVTFAWLSPTIAAASGEGGSGYGIEHLTSLGSQFLIGLVYSGAFGYCFPMVQAMATGAGGSIIMSTAATATQMLASEILIEEIMLPKFYEWLFDQIMPAGPVRDSWQRVVKMSEEFYGNVSEIFNPLEIAEMIMYGMGVGATSLAEAQMRPNSGKTFAMALAILYGLA